MITVRLDEVGDKTPRTLVPTGMPAGENTERTRAFWSESFDKPATVVE